MKLVFHPDPLLKQRCETIHRFDQNLKSIVDQMLDVMYSSGGVGLAAPQVGLGMDLFLVDPTGGETRDGLVVMVNPVLTFPNPRKVRMNEGCLSIPGTYLDVERPDVVQVTFQDVKGNVKAITLDGWPSRITQHEYDHLRGVLMFDRIETGRRQSKVRR